MVRKYAVIKDNKVTNIILLHDKDIFSYIGLTREVIIDITEEHILKINDSILNESTEERYSPDIGWEYDFKLKTFKEPGNGLKLYTLKNK